MVSDRKVRRRMMRDVFLSAMKARTAVGTSDEDGDIDYYDISDADMVRITDGRGESRKWDEASFSNGAGNNSNEKIIVDGAKVNREMVENGAAEETLGASGA